MFTSFSDLLDRYCLQQVVNESTHNNGNLLDCVFVNNDDIIHSLSVNPTLQSVTHHKIIEISTPLYVMEKKASQPNNNLETSGFK